MQQLPWRQAFVIYDIATESALWRVSNAVREGLPAGWALESTTNIDGVQSVVFRLAGPVEIADGQTVRQLLDGLGIAATAA